MIPQPERIPRAERRRQKRAAQKAANPPKYGPVVIYTQVHERVEDEKGRVKFNRSYQGRTNVRPKHEIKRK